MALNCEACSDLREYAPDFVLNGVTEDICTSLENDTGLNPSLDPIHNDCEDLNNVNDCLVGNMEAELDAYEVCDWKAFMKKLIPNTHQTLKTILCSICGMWKTIHCTMTGLRNLIDKLNETTQGQAFIRYYRDDSGTGEGYEWDNIRHSEHTLNIFMDCNLDNPGTQNADRDYLVIISDCTDIYDTANCGVTTTFYSSGDTRPIATIRKRQAQHPLVCFETKVINFSWTVTGAVTIKKGEHVKVNTYISSSDGQGQYRLHQFVLTWIPINAGDADLDPTEIIPC